MSGPRAWTALGGSLLSLVIGCSASPDAKNGSHGRGGDTGNPSGGGSSVAGSPNTTTLGRDAVAQRCDATQLAPPQLRRLTGPELERTLRDAFPVLGSSWSGVRLGADPVSSLGFSNDARSLVVASQTAQELLGTAEDVATALTAPAALAGLQPCAAEAAPGRACADQLLKNVGSRLFRRAFSQDEASDYGALYDSVAAKSDFATGVRWALVAMIQSPSTVYRSELGVAGAATRQLSPEELATELGYTYSGTAPSADLLAAAQRGELATPAARVAKAKELLATPNGRQQLHQFLAEWSGYGRVASKTKTTVDDFETLRGAMLQETKLFLDEAVIIRKGGVKELLTASYTFIDSSLSGLYGFGAASGRDFVLAQRPAGRGLGLLAQGSILAGSAHADASSPTLRGLVVYEKLLCHQKPKPPPNIPAIASPMPGATTTRARYEVSHGGNPGCKSCHQFFDPVGYGFEHFDEAGRYRADENGLPLDTSGQVLAMDGTPVFTLDGLDDLATKLAGRAEVADCVSGLAAAYAFAGAGGRTCLAEDARTAFAGGELGVLDYFAQLAAAPSFAERAP